MKYKIRAIDENGFPGTLTIEEGAYKKIPFSINDGHEMIIIDFQLDASWREDSNPEKSESNDEKWYGDE